MATTPERIKRAPIGVFDSGVGGLSVLRHIREALPHESLLYVADSRHAPYGEKSAEFIRARADYLSDFLLAQGAKALVLACNTATAAAARHLRARLAVPIIGMEPAVKPAAKASASGIIGVLATSGTLKSAQFAALLDTWGKNVRCITQAGAGLVECVERGELDTPATREKLAAHLKPLLEAGADTLVLGCTHYPFLRQAIRELAGPQITLIDTGEAVARHLARVLGALDLLAPEGAAVQCRFWTCSECSRAHEVMERLWGESVAVEPLPIV